MADEYVEISDFDEVAEVLLGRPRLRAHLLTISLVVTVVVLLLWAALARFDLTIKASGVVRPTGDVARVQAVLGGTTKEVLVQEGDTVPAGAVLVRLDLASQRAESDRLDTTLAGRASALDAQRRSRESLLSQQSLEERAREEAIRQAEAKVAAAGEQLRVREERARSDARLAALELAHARSTEDLKKKMFDAKIGSEQDWKEATKARETAEEKSKQAEQALASIDRSDLKLAEGDQEREKAAADAQRGAAKRTLEDKEREVSSLEAEIAELKQRLTSVKEELAKGEIAAPCAGTVQALTVRRPGEFVSAGQQLAVIVPRGARLVVEAYVANQDIGQVHEGQQAKFSFQAFPYQKYGTLSGKVEWKAGDAEQVDTGGGKMSVYKVRLSLAESEFRSGGEAQPVQIGMQVEVSSVTGSETALTLLWRKVKGKFAP